MSQSPPLTESTVARTIRRALPGAKWSVLQRAWLVPADELVQLIFENRRMKGEPPLWSDVERAHE